MAIYALEGHEPEIDLTAWVADSAQVIGQVTLEAGVNVWFGAVLRGDVERLYISRNTNIQDGTVVHCDRGYPLSLGPGVTVGHRVVLHGCSVGENSLIGMGAILLNGCKIGKNSLVAAGSLVTEGKEFPDDVLIMGSPAKVVRELTAQQLQGLKKSAEHYVANAQRYRGALRRLT
jgi:carbonic anhydrase/acetyltransferase-like protein (isoleucine patch superfamily)